MPHSLSMPLLRELCFAFVAGAPVAAPAGAASASARDAIGGPESRSPPVIAIVDVTLLPMDREGALPHVTVITRGAAIVAIGPTSGDGAVALPAGATRIDGAGRWLLPGLIDNHVHCLDPRDLVLHLAHGVTTVRNLKGAPWHLELREAIRRGERIGPTFLTAGPFLNEPQFRTPEQFESEARRQADAGYDCLKMHGDLAEEAYERLFITAEELGLPLVGHVPRNLPLKTVLEIGPMAEISHAEELVYTHFQPLRTEGDARAIPGCIELLKAAGTALTPTLVAFENIAPQVEDLAAVLASPAAQLLPPAARELFGPRINHYVRRFRREDCAWLRSSREFQARIVKAAHAAGVPVLLGTDCGIPVVVPGVAAAKELENLVGAGLSPWEALAAATVRNGDFLQQSPPIGRIAVGATADLLLLDADPLADIAAVRRVAGVMSRGRWFGRQELDQLLAARAASFAPETALAPLIAVDSTKALLTAVRALPRAADGRRPLDDAFLFSIWQVYLNANLPHLAAEVLACIEE